MGPGFRYIASCTLLTSFKHGNAQAGIITTTTTTKRKSNTALQPPLEAVGCASECSQAQDEKKREGQGQAFNLAGVDTEVENQLGVQD